MTSKGIILQGSSRSNGNTHKIVAHIQKETGFDIVDLSTKTIGVFDYEFKNKNDDFLPLIKDIVANYDTIVLATPVYWYSMSATMKTFFDRLSDCLITEKDTGRQLRGKRMGMISCGSDANLKEGFTMPFVETAHYLGMKYLGDIHTWIENDHIPNKVEIDLADFIKKLLQ